MTYLKPALALAAAMSLSACLPGETTTTVTSPGTEPVVIATGPDVAPAAPNPTSGTPGDDSLTGTWNLLASECSDPASKGRLVIEGNKFTFPSTECTATSSSVESNFTRVSLGCASAPNRELNISIRPGAMRMTEDTTTLTYYKCT